MLAVVSRNLQKVKLHRVPQEKAWENVFMLVCCFSAPKDMLVLQSVFSRHDLTNEAHCLKDSPLSHTH